MENQNETKKLEVTLKSVNCNAFQKKYNENILRLILMPLKKMTKPQLCDFINHNSNNWFSGTQLKNRKEYLINIAQKYYEKGDYIQIRRQYEISKILE